MGESVNTYKNMENQKNFRFLDMNEQFEDSTMVDFLNASKEFGGYNIVNTACGKYATAETKDGIQMWYQTSSKDEWGIISYNMHYKSGTRSKVHFCSWIASDKNKMRGLARVRSERGDTEIELNLDVINAGMFADFNDGEVTAQIAAFGERVTIYENEEAFAEHEKNLEPEACISIGTFAEFQKGGKQSPYVDLSAKILAVYSNVNSYTKEEYYHLVVTCHGLRLDVVVLPEYINEEPKVGGYLHGVLYLTARLFETSNDENLMPCFSINTNKIIENWKSLVLDDEYEEPCEGWKLIAYPIMPDKSIVLIFQNEMDGEDSDISRYFYRFLHYDKSGKLINKERMYLDGEEVVTAFFDKKEHLHIIFSPEDAEYIGVFDAENENVPHHSRVLEDDVSRIIVDSKGNIYVGKDFSNYENYRDMLIKGFDENGKRIFSDIDVGYRCAELAIDEDENIWCYTEPVTMLHKLVYNEGEYLRKKVNIPLSRICSIAFSKDGKKMFCECEGLGDFHHFYLLTREDSGYMNPQEIRMPLLIQESCYTYGACSTTKDRIMFNVDGALYMYKLEN